MMRYFSLLSLITSTLVFHSAHAETKAPDPILSQLMQELSQYSDLATKQRINLDHVPGMMSVLTRSDLRAYGANNLYQALGIIPGVVLGATQNIVMRDLANMFGSSRLKLMINNQPVNNSFVAFAGHLFYMPTEAIERIEIIRGPGVVLYGEFAFSGVINVITRKGGYVSAQVGSDDLYSLNLGESHTRGDTHHQFNLSLLDHGGNNQLSTDGLAVLPGRSAESRVNQGIEFAQFGYQGEAKQWQWSLLYEGFGKGDGTGTSSVKPLPSDQPNLLDNSLALTVRKQLLDTQDQSRHVQVNLDRYHFRLKDVVFYPAGLLETDTYPGDIQSNFYYYENKLEAKYENQLKFKQGARLLLGARAAFIRPSDLKQCYTLDPTDNYAYSNTASCYTGHFAQGNYFPDATQRDITSGYMQLTQQLDDRFTLISGLRMDYYSDLDALYLSPSLSGQLQLGETSLAKIQLTTGTRVPNFTELYLSQTSFLNGNPSLKPEKIQSLEASYIHHSPGLRWALTGFVNRIEDPISVEADTAFYTQYDIPARTYTNGEQLTVYGLEAESKWQLNPQWRLEGQLSLQKSTSQDTQGEIEDATPWMLDVMSEYRPHPRYRLSLYLNADGRVKRAEGDTRGDFHAQHYFNLQAGYKPSDRAWGEWMLSIKNLEGKALTLPSASQTLWPDDYPHWFSGRVFDLTWSKKF